MHKTKSHILGVYFGFRPLKPLTEPLSQQIKLWITKPKIFERKKGFEFQKFEDSAKLKSYLINKRVGKNL